MAARSDKTLPSFNLDTVLNAETDAQPFAFILGGKVRYLQHQANVPLVDTEDLSDRSSILKVLETLALDENTYTELVAANMTVGHARKLIAAWREYCGIGSGE